MVLSALKEQGTTPNMVQIGNEVTNGMLWPDGSAKDHFDDFAELLKSGIAAARHRPLDENRPAPRQRAQQQSRSRVA